jgi:hypothetical protein
VRIPATRVYRAFPELDHFSDAQCEAFVRATSRRPAYLAVQLLGELSTTTAALLSFGFLSGHAGARLEQATSHWGSLNSYVAPFAWLLITLVPSGLVFLLTRDLLLRRCIRSLLKTRGSCRQCGYGLTGLPVGEGGRITCPECGLEFMADPVLEIRPDATGRMRFTPSPLTGISH